MLAAADGTVVTVRDDLADQPIGVFGQGEGNAIVLGIGGGRYVVLEHLQQGSALVRAGQSVTRGQRIAAVGNTGNSLSPHLHLQIQDRPSLASHDREVRTFPIAFENTTLTRGGRESAPLTADLRRGPSAPTLTPSPRHDSNDDSNAATSVRLHGAPFAHLQAPQRPPRVLRWLLLISGFGLDPSGGWRIHQREIIKLS